MDRSTLDDVIESCDWLQSSLGDIGSYTDIDLRDWSEFDADSEPAEDFDVSGLSAQLREIISRCNAISADASALLQRLAAGVVSDSFGISSGGGGPGAAAAGSGVGLRFCCVGTYRCPADLPASFGAFDTSTDCLMGFVSEDNSRRLAALVSSADCERLYDIAKGHAESDASFPYLHVFESDLQGIARAVVPIGERAMFKLASGRCKSLAVEGGAA